MPASIVVLAELPGAILDEDLVIVSPPGQRIPPTRTGRKRPVEPGADGVADPVDADRGNGEIVRRTSEISGAINQSYHGA